MRRVPSAPGLRSRPLVRWTAAGCALLVWALGLLAASPELHEKLHADAGRADHACAVTIFHQGVEDTGAAAPPLVVVWRVVERVAALPSALRLTETGGLLPPSCGPPTA
jgi:hypothetical protein